MLPILQIGPLAIQTPGLIIILGIWMGLSLAERLSHRHKTDSSILYNLAFTFLVAGILGARLVYATRYFDIFLSAPLNLISLNSGLLDPIGGTAVGLIIALIYGNRKGVSLLPTLDALTPMLAIFMIALGLAQFASGDAFGIETTLPWGIHLWGAKRHPTQIYHALLSILILTTIVPRPDNPRVEVTVPGKTFLSFIALSAGAHLFLDAFRGDGKTIIYNIHTTQVTAWFILILSLWGLWKLKGKDENLEESR